MMAVVWNSRQVGGVRWRPELVIPSLDEPRHGHSGLGQDARGSRRAAPAGCGPCPGDRSRLCRGSRAVGYGAGPEGGSEGAGASTPALRRERRRSAVRGASIRLRAARVHALAAKWAEEACLGPTGANDAGGHSQYACVECSFITRPCGTGCVSARKSLGTRRGKERES